MMRGSAAVFATTAAMLAVAPAAAVDVAAPVAISDVVPYSEPSAPGPYLGACSWNLALPRAIVAASEGRVVTTRSSLATLPGTVLFLTVAQMNVGTGGNWNGRQSWILLHGELREDGRLVETVDFRRGWTKAWSGCRAARKIGDLLAADVAAWVRHRASTPPSSRP